MELRLMVNIKNVEIKMIYYNFLQTKTYTFRLKVTLKEI